MKARALVFLIALSFLGSGCHSKPGFRAHEVPSETAKLTDLSSPVYSESAETEEAEENPELNELEAPEDSSQGQSMVEIGYWVIRNEARKVGAACNFFIQRVFALMGFGKSSWLANDFDSYVQKSFASFKKESFRWDSTGAERARLKRYLWSFPEGEGVILQWKRKVGPGHVAIIHRVGNEFVLYHASLKKFIPKAQRANLETLLHRPLVGYSLNVFSDFQKNENP